MTNKQLVKHLCEEHNFRFEMLQVFEQPLYLSETHNLTYFLYD